MAYNTQGFTLIELIIVLAIIGILITLGLPSYHNIKEQALDKEAKVNLKLIQAAEKIYRMEVGGYYLSTGGTSTLNDNLKLSLPTASSANWIYSVVNLGLGNISRSTREFRPGVRGRSWLLDIDNDEEPICAVGGGDPCL